MQHQVIDADVRSWALSLMQELDANRLEVVLIPAPRPMHATHCIRMAGAQNPQWYQDLCSRHASIRCDRRHYQTAIKRAHTLAGLRALASGRRGRYADLLLNTIDRVRLAAANEDAYWAAWGSSCR